MDDSHASTELVPQVGPEDIGRLQAYVKRWMQVDAQVRHDMDTIKQLRKAKAQLSESIMDLMRKANIEDINTREGTLRYNVRMVKPTVSSKCVRERLVDALKDRPADESEAILDTVFKEERSGERAERVSLRRMGGGGAPTRISGDTDV